jgi:hypothetical protein
MLSEGKAVAGMQFVLLLSNFHMQTDAEHNQEERKQNF